MKYRIRILLLVGSGLNVAAIFILLNGVDQRKHINYLARFCYCIYFVVLTLGVFNWWAYGGDGRKGSFLGILLVS